MTDRVRIVDDGWELLTRIAVGLASRMLIRGVPLLESVDWNQQARRILDYGRKFSLGVQVNPFITQKNLRDILEQMESLPHPSGNRTSSMVSRATLHLGMSINLAAGALTLAESQNAISEISDQLVSAGKIALEARDGLREAISAAATNHDDENKVAAALRSELEAFESYRTSEISRLDPGDEDDEVRIGPSFDPSGLGPLGPIWPSGEPSWYRVGAEDVTGVVLAQNFDPKERGNARVVAYYNPESDFSGFLKNALAFTAHVLTSTPRGEIPPTPCVYVPSMFKGRHHSIIIGELASAGAVPLDDRDLNTREQPHSPEDFAHAVQMLHHSITNQGRFKSFDGPVMGFAPANLPSVPPLDDKRWKRVSSTSASYESLVRRSSEEATDGWPAAE